MLRQFFNSLVPQNEEAIVSSENPTDEKLQISELRYRRLFEAAQDGILILDATIGKITDANPFLKEILGYSQTELVGKQLWQIGVFKDIVDSKKAFQELQAKGYIRYKDLPLQTKDGGIIDVEFISNIYLVGKERVIQCNIRDITNRKKIEQAMEERTKQLELLTKSQEETKQAMLNVMEDLETVKALIELEKVKDEAMLASIGEGLVAVDNERKILVINKSAEKMLGWKRNEVLGKEITSLPLADKEGNILPFNKRPTFIALRTNKELSGTYFFIRKDKTRFPVSISVTPIKHGDKIIGALDIFRDISREQEIDKAKSEFVFIVSHQLRTPLGIIKWYLEALEDEDYFRKSPLIIRQYVDEIHKNNKRILNLVRELLSVSRIEQGRVKDAPTLVNPLQIVKEIVGQLQIMAQKKKITLRLIIQDGKIPSMNIDVLRLHEVIENLIVNAIEYTEAQGLVKVSVKKQGNTFLMSVKDTGIGISEADQEKLFTKFFRSEKAMVQNSEGSGLGLYVVKSYVEGWGGKISVDSHEGKGTTFMLTLPIPLKKEGR